MGIARWLAATSGFDTAVTDLFYDGASARFPAHDSY